MVNCRLQDPGHFDSIKFMKLAEFGLNAFMYCRRATSNRISLYFVLDTILLSFFVQIIPLQIDIVIAQLIFFYYFYFIHECDL